MTKIKIIILLLVASLFSFRQTTEIELNSDNVIKEDVLVETVEEKANVEELPIIEDTFEEVIEEKNESSNSSSNIKSNTKKTSKTQKKNTTKENKTETSKKEELNPKDNKELTNETKTEEKETKVDPPKQEEPKQDDKPKEEEKPKKVTCDDFYESIHKGRVDTKTKSACISYGKSIQSKELDEVIEYNKTHDNSGDININYFTCYEVLDVNCNTKGWYLHFKCNTKNCDDSKIKKMYG